MSVVTLASRIVSAERRNPICTALRPVFPERSSSRIRSKMMTLASTAIPRVRTRPAIPGSVRVARARLIAPMIMTMFTTSARQANQPLRA